MTRLAKVPVDEWSAELVALTGADGASALEQGMVRVMAQRPELALAFARYASATNAAARLPARLRELVRLRIAFHNQCRTCMTVRYRSAADAGVTAELVCQLERPEQGVALSEAEKAALSYVDLFATDHLAIDDAVFDRLRAHFGEDDIVELGMFTASSIGFGRLAAVWDMTEDLPQANRTGDATPWDLAPVLVAG